MRTYQSLIAGLLITLFALTNAIAGDLTTDDAKRVIAALEDFKAYNTRHRDADVSGLVPEGNPLTADSLNADDGTPQIFRQIADRLVFTPEMKTDFERRVLEDNGFQRKRDWAETTDAVFAAYLLLQVEDFEAPSNFPLTAEELAELPAEQRPVVNALNQIVRLRKAVPPENIEAVRPLAKEIERLDENWRGQ